MTFPNKGSRKTAYRDHEYRWYVRRKPTYHQGVFQTPMTVAIERVGAQRVLLVDLRVSRPDNWILAHATSLTPGVVRDIVAGALEQGWDPESTGPAFTHTHPLIKDGMVRTRDGR